MEHPQLEALFNKQTDIIGFKKDLLSPVAYALNMEQLPQFFFINPLKQRQYGKGAGAASNVRVCQNILFEWDTGAPLEEQYKLAIDSKLPYTSCVYSGGKSLHFIVSLSEPIEAKWYTHYARVAFEALGSDISMANPNRISRLGGATREGGALQELIEANPNNKITISQFVAWVLYGPITGLKAPKIVQRLEKQEQARMKVISEGPRTELPKIYKDMIEGGALHPNTNSRHESLVKFASWIKNNWHKPEELDILIQKAADSLGIAGRGDAENIIKYFGG